MTKYEINKRWRHKYPDRWQKGKKRYYDKTKGAKNSGDKWTQKEQELVIAHEMTDIELSQKIGRSVGAIQNMRHKLKGRCGNDAT